MLRALKVKYLGKLADFQNKLTIWVIEGREVREKAVEIVAIELNKLGREFKVAEIKVKAQTPEDLLAFAEKIEDAANAKPKTKAAAK